MSVLESICILLRFLMIVTKLIGQVELNATLFYENILMFPEYQ